MKRLLVLFILNKVLPVCKTANGVIWSKTQQTFVPISSIPIYAKMQQERLERSRALETHNFQLQNLTLTFFEDPPFLTFHDNDTRISGLYGDIWTLLSESLNFTLQPVRANVNSLGVSDHYSYKDGLLGIIYRNETVAIPKIEMYQGRSLACDYMLPFWINGYQFYIRPEGIHDNTWMIEIFSWEIWVVVFMMHILLSLSTFLRQSILVRIYGTKYNRRPFNEHLFYSYRNLCNQSIILEHRDGGSGILEISSSLYSVVMSIAFNALLFTYITKRVFVPPFDSIESMVADTDYRATSFNGSTEHLIFQVTDLPGFVKMRTLKRLTVTSTIEEMHKLACFSRKEKYAIFQGIDEHNVKEHTMCYLMPVTRRYYKIWMGSCTKRNFKYKRTLDIGILRLMEAGLLTGLKNYWLKRRFEPDINNDMLHPIEMQQISLVIAMACSGVIIALVIFVIENIVFIYKIKCS